MSTLEDNYKRSCDELAKAKEALNTANALLVNAFEAFDDWLIATEEDFSHNPEWKAARAVVDEIANLKEGE